MITFMLNTSPRALIEWTQIENGKTRIIKQDRTEKLHFVIVECFTVSNK